MNASAQILFEFLRSILYETDIRKLNTQMVDADHQDLAQGMNYLADCVTTLTDYSKALSTGELGILFPKENDRLCMNLKNLHANLNHLTWQAQQVAEGDYSQRVSYLGEFSVAFNKMTAQLKDREDMMKREAEEAEKRARQYRSYNEMLIALTAHRPELIIVADQENENVLYCNRCDREKILNRGEDEKLCSLCGNDLKICRMVMDSEIVRGTKDWEISGTDGQNYYRSTSYPIIWEGQDALVHIVEDITKDKREELNLTGLVYRDPGTGFYNRRFMLDCIETALGKGEAFTFVFIDIDGLKFVNDNFGHTEGDAYIQRIGEAIQNAFRISDVVARLGGDEFGAMLPKCKKEVATRIMNRLYEDLRKDKDSGYQKSLSYGFTEVSSGSHLTPDEIIRKADREMYECKRQHKKLYNDGRS